MKVLNVNTNEDYNALTDDVDGTIVIKEDEEEEINETDGMNRNTCNTLATYNIIICE